VFVSLGLSGVFVSLERVRGETEKERKREEKERDSSRNRSYHARIQAREKETKERRSCLFCPAAIQSPECASTYRTKQDLCSLFLSVFLAQTPASRFTSSVFLMNVCAQGMQREIKQIPLCQSLSSQSLSLSLSLSHGSTAPRVLVSQ
jgi:hypothetical protein